VATRTVVEGGEHAAGNERITMPWGGWGCVGSIFFSFLAGNLVTEGYTPSSKNPLIAMRIAVVVINEAGFKLFSKCGWGGVGIDSEYQITEAVFFTTPPKLANSDP
jgi:hypothetical protein